DVAVDGDFELIYIVGNTLFCLLTQGEQLRCLCNVRKKLTSSGTFVTEFAVFGGQTLRDDWHQEVLTVASDSVLLQLSRTDIPRQVLETQLIWIKGKEVHLYPSQYRFVWPAELDLMA